MKIFWERLITAPYNSHLPWLSIFSLDWIPQILLWLGVVGWFVLVINTQNPTAQLTKTEHESRKDVLLALLIAASSYCIYSIFTLELLAASVFFPWLLIIVSRLKSTASPFRLQLSLLTISILMACSTSSLAPLNAALLLILFFLLGYYNNKLFWTLALPSLAVYLLSPVLSWPDFPGHARLLSDDGLPGIIRPLLGPAVPIPIFDRYLAWESYRSFLLYAGILLVIITTSKLVYKKSVSTVILLSLLFVTSILYWDLATSAIWSELSPLKSLARIVPGWFEAPLFIILLGTLINCLFYVAVLISTKINLKIRYSSALLLLTASYLLLSAQSNLPNNRIEPLTSNSWALSKQNPVIRNMSCDNLNVVKNKLESSFVPAAEYIEEIKFSRTVDQRNTRRIIDRNRRTRWSSKSQGQKGNEWVQLTFNQTVKLHAIEIDPGFYQSDFPRGLEIIDCSNEASDSVLFRQQDWQGQVEFTPAGIPFYSYQSHVRAWLGCQPTAVSVNCLRINQIGIDPVYDWSVAEIRLGLTK